MPAASTARSAAAMKKAACWTVRCSWRRNRIISALSKRRIFASNRSILLPPAAEQPARKIPKREDHDSGLSRHVLELNVEIAHQGLSLFANVPAPCSRLSPHIFTRALFRLLRGGLCASMTFGGLECLELFFQLFDILHDVAICHVSSSLSWIHKVYFQEY